MQKPRVARPLQVEHASNSSFQLLGWEQDVAVVMYTIPPAEAYHLAQILPLILSWIERDVLLHRRFH